MRSSEKRIANFCEFCTLVLDGEFSDVSVQPMPVLDRGAKRKRTCNLILNEEEQKALTKLENSKKCFCMKQQKRKKERRIHLSSSSKLSCLLLLLLFFFSRLLLLDEQSYRLSLRFRRLLTLLPNSNRESLLESGEEKDKKAKGLPLFSFVCFSLLVRLLLYLGFLQRSFGGTWRQ